MLSPKFRLKHRPGEADAMEQKEEFPGPIQLDGSNEDSEEVIVLEDSSSLSTLSHTPPLQEAGMTATVVNHILLEAETNREATVRMHSAQQQLTDPALQTVTIQDNAPAIDGASAFPKGPAIKDRPKIKSNSSEAESSKPATGSAPPPLQSVNVENANVFHYERLLEGSFKSSYNTPFILKATTAPKSEYMVHKELLCEISPKVRTLCANGESYKESLTRAVGLRETITDALYTGVGDEKLCEVLKQCWIKYPLVNYREDVRRIVKVQTNATFNNANMRKPSSSKASSRRATPAIDETPLRLDCLNSEAIEKVAQKVRDELLRIEALELEKCKTNSRVAVAHNRLYLNDVKNKTVQILITWMYETRMFYESAADLCDLYGIAKRLEISALEDQCLHLLISGIYHQAEYMRSANCGSPQTGTVNAAMPVFEGLPDADVFEYEGENVIKTVLTYFRGDVRLEQAAELFRQLVIEVLAFVGTVSAFDSIKDGVQLPMSLELNRVLLSRKATAGKRKAPGDLHDRFQHLATEWVSERDAKRICLRDGDDAPSAS